MYLSILLFIIVYKDTHVIMQIIKKLRYEFLKNIKYMIVKIFETEMHKFLMLTFKTT